MSLVFKKAARPFSVKSQFYLLLILGEQMNPSYFNKANVPTLERYLFYSLRISSVCAVDFLHTIESESRKTNSHIIKWLDYFLDLRKTKGLPRFPYVSKEIYSIPENVYIPW